MAERMFPERWAKMQRCANGKKRRKQANRLRRSAVSWLVLRPFYTRPAQMPDTTPLDGYAVLNG
jgi:hypothetical protein